MTEWLKSKEHFCLYNGNDIKLGFCLEMIKGLSIFIVYSNYRLCFCFGLFLMFQLQTSRKLENDIEKGETK